MILAGRSAGGMRQQFSRPAGYCPSRAENPPVITARQLIDSIRQVAGWYKVFDSARGRPANPARIPIRENLAGWYKQLCVLVKV